MQNSAKAFKAAGTILKVLKPENRVFRHYVINYHNDKVLGTRDIDSLLVQGKKGPRGF